MKTGLSRSTFIMVFLLLSFLLSVGINGAQAQCGCKYVITLNPAEFQFDGAAKGVQPGDKICFTSGTRASMYFVNVNGTAAQPVLITNMCDGKVTIKNASTASYGIEFHKSSFFHVTGSGNTAENFGITIDGGTMGIDLKELSHDFEVDHLKVFNTGYAGIVAKTDPTCDPATWRGNFTMTNTIFHDNDVSTLGGEGFYIGSSHYYTTVPRTCNAVTIQVQEHEQTGVHVYNNNVHDTGRDGIQVGSTTTDCAIHHNSVYNFGMTNEYSQQTGIQVNPGTNAEVYNNIVDTGTGYGVFLGGEGASHLYNNIIMNSLQGGIICQDYAPVNPAGFIMSNNTMIGNNDYGIYMFSQNTIQNLFVNNIIIAGGVTVETSFLYVRLNNPPAIKWTDTNNIKTTAVATVKFANVATKDFHLLTGSPAIDGGTDMTANGITFDLDEKTRPKGTKFDIGAYEFTPGGPTSNAGTDQSVTLPTNSVLLNGSGTSGTGITGYLWTKKSGGAATLTNATTASLSASGLVQGIYVFELQVTDIVGSDFDDVTVTVLPSTANQNPTANAGVDKTITLPTSSLTLNGIGTDPDGTIAGYAWTKVTGPAATLVGAATANLSLSGLVAGTYVFQLTVTDDKGATASDGVNVIVNAATVNQPPVVNGGGNKTIFLPANSVTLTATASDADGTIASVGWIKKSGGAATLSGQTSLSLSVTGLLAGTYVFRITATDDKAAQTFVDVTVTVIQANQSPTANAGPDQPITLPTNSATLPGSGTDADGTIATYAWTQVSGPNAATLANANTASLSVSNMIQGAYVFGLTVTDNSAATGYDEVVVAVSVASTGPNEIPLAIAGGNISFSLPTNSVNLYGSGFDPDGTITTYAWVKLSGGTATLSNADKPTLTVAGLAAGQYTFGLTVTDDKGATDDDVAIVTISDLGTNISPVASAGADKIVKLPQASAVLDGTGTDADGQITTYAWTQVSGAVATIATPASPSTSVSNLVLGDYQFRLTVTDNLGATDFNDIVVRVVASTNNLPPIVSAGPDVTIYSPQTALTLNATASDDGTITAYQWTKLGGPTATLLNPTGLNLSLSNLVEGNYSFQLTVTDNNAASVFDIVSVAVLPAAFQPPVVDAGADQQIALPTNQINLTGTATSPNGSITGVLWTQTLGPAATLTNDNTLTLQVTNMLVGTYVFTLTATDNTGVTVSDNVQVIVNPVPPNQPPLVIAGANQIIILPASQATLSGTATDTDGTVAGVQWTQIQGPSAATLQNATTVTLTASNLIAGNYLFKLAATDDDNATGSATAFVIVSTPGAVKNPPAVYAGGSITLTLPRGDTTIVGNAVSPNGFIDQYVWEQSSGAPATFTSLGDSLHLTNMAAGQYTFTLTVIDSDSLSASDILTVQVIEKTQEIPKFFSPNNDGIGEFWVFRNVDAYKACRLSVFSRSGQVVYEAAPYVNSWDGTYNGKPLGNGDYYYNIKCDDGKVLNGAVRIIR